MVEIKDLLVRFQNILLSEEDKRISIREAILEATQIQIKKEDIKIKNNIIYLNIKPIYKSEIYLNREKIFNKLKELFGRKIPQNIR